MSAKSRAKYWVDDGKGHRGKCDEKNRCPALRMAIQGETRSRGLGTALLMNFRTGISKTIILYRKGAGDDGIVLNHCPWCGVKINVEVKKESEPEKKPIKRSPSEELFTPKGRRTKT